MIRSTSLFRNEAGSSSTFGLIASLLILPPAIAYAVLQVEQPAPENLAYADLTQEGARLLDQILRTSTTTWQADPDNASAFGLAAGGAYGKVDAAALRDLRRGGSSASGDSPLGYEAARTLLGVDAGHFQLRVRPVENGDPWIAPERTRAAYVAHYSGAAAPAAVRATLDESPERLGVALEIVNQADQPALFSTEISLGNESSAYRTFTQSRHTPLLAPGASHVVHVTYDALTAWEPTLTSLWFTVVDPYGNPASDRLGAPARGWISIGPLPTTSPAPYVLHVAATQPYFVNGSGVTFRVDHSGAEGARVRGAEARLVLTDPAGAEVHNASVLLPSQPNKAHQHECPSCNATGTYTLRVWNSDMTRLQVEHVHLSASRMFTEKRTLDPIAWREIDYMQAMVPGFQPTRYHPDGAPEGDVFGDDSNGPSEIARILSRYDLIVIGSNVDQDALMAASVRHGLHDWLLQGGSLVVLGVQHQSARWLQATAGIGLQPTAAPVEWDMEDSLLQWPSPLRIHEYVSHDRAWRSGARQFAAAGSAGSDHVIAVSRPGTFGSGTLLLSAVIPGLLTSPHDDEEGHRLLQNLVAHALGATTVELGPDPPAGATVASWRRVVWAEDAQRGHQYLVEVELLRFR